MTAQLYYTAPSDVVFDEMKRACMEVWAEYGDEGGYRSEKLARIEDIGNIRDNFMYMFAMFDHLNQRKVVGKLRAEAKKELKERMISGGNPDYYLSAIGL